MEQRELVPTCGNWNPISGCYDSGATTKTFYDNNISLHHISRLHLENFVVGCIASLYFASIPQASSKVKL
jgi:hypothetical protein